MGFKFSADSNDELVLIYNNKIVAHVKHISGFDILKTYLIDEAVNNLNNDLSSMEDNVMENSDSINTPCSSCSNKENINPFLYLINCIFGILFIISWIGGIVLAKTGWLKILAIFPLYGWYLEVSLLFSRLGFI